MLKSGAIWVLASNAGGQVLRLFSNLILAWLLLPEDFGLAALAAVFFYGAVMISDAGTDASLIRSKRGDEPLFYNTAWTFQLLRGLLLWLFCCLIALPASQFYGEEQLQWLLVVGGFGLFVQGFKSTALVSMMRDMCFKRLAIYELIAQLCSIIVSVIVAWVWRDAMALVLGIIVNNFVLVVLGHVLHRSEVQNRLCWESDAFKELFHFGKWVFASSFVGFLAMQADKLLLGKIASMEVLGVYAVAFGLAQLPNFVVKMLASKFLYPVFVQFAKKPREDLVREASKIRNMMLPFMLFVTLGVVLLSGPFFVYLYKASFHDAVWIAPAIALFLWFEMMVYSLGGIPLAMGDSRALATTWLYIFIVRLLASYLGFLNFDLEGFIAGLALGSFVGYVYIAIYIKKYGFHVLKYDAKYSLVLIIVSASYFIVKPWVEEGLSSLLLSIAFVALSALISIQIFQRRQK